LSDAADVPVTILLSRRRKSWENAVAFRVEEMIQTAVGQKGALIHERTGPGSEVQKIRRRS
jgi:hypothetical protein